MKNRRHMCIPVLLVLVLAFVSLAVPGSLKANNSTGEKYEEMAVDPTSSGDVYSAVLYDNKTGLPTSEANAISETE